MNFANELQKVWNEIKDLKQRTKRLTSRGGGGGGGGGGGSTINKGRFTAPTVEALPAIPTTADTLQFVRWTSAGSGTGDDSVWQSYTGDARWYPLTYSTLDGTPGAEELQ